MATGSARAGPSLFRRRARVIGMVAVVVLVIGVAAGLWAWRAPVLELAVAGAPTRYLRLGDELQFALAWEGLTEQGQRTVAIVLLEAIDGKLSVISSTVAGDGEQFAVGPGDVRFTVVTASNPALIYGGGQLVLSGWYPDRSQLVIRYRRVPVVQLWGGS